MLCARGPGLAASAAALCFTSGPSLAQLHVTSVIERGDPIAGAPPGVLFRGPQGDIALSPSGEVLINCDLQGPGVVPSTPGQYALLRGTAAAGVSLVVRGGMPAPGTPTGVHFNGGGGSSSPFALGQLRGDGAVSFLGRISGPGIGNPQRGFWRYSEGGGALVMRMNDPAPGLPAGVALADFNSGIFCDTGGMVIEATLMGPGITPDNRRMLYGGPAYAPVVLAREGSAAPALPAGTTLTLLTGGPSLSPAGEAAFAGRTAAGAATGSAIWAGRPGDLRVMALQGQPAPGFAPGSTFGELLHPTINAAGQVTFHAWVAGPTSGQGVYRADADGPRLIARSGGQVPGFGPGNIFHSIYAGPVLTQAPFSLNAKGEVLHYALLTGPAFGSESFGLFRSDGEESVLVARTGGQAPGLPEGTLFNSVGSACMNDAGQVIFLGRTGPAVHDLWGFDGEQTRRLLAAGDQVVIDSDQTRTIQNFIVSLGSNPSGYGGMGLGNNGVVAVWLGFTDGTAGVYTFNIPAAGTMVPLALAGGAACSRRRRSTSL